MRILQVLERIAVALEKQTVLAEAANQYNAAVQATNEQLVKNQDKMLHIQEEQIDLNKVRMVSKANLS